MNGGEKTKEMKRKISIDEIKEASKADYQKQTSYDNAYDRQKGFVEGAKWAIDKLNQQPLNQ